MAETKYGIPDIRIHIQDIAEAARICGEMEIVAAGSMYATIIGYEEVKEKLNNKGIWWTYD